MSDLNFRNERNESINYQQWAELKINSIATTEEMTVAGYIVRLTKMYFGTVGSVFKVFIECSSDLLQYHHYIKHYEGELEATNDFNRCLFAIESDGAVFDKTETSGLISLYYDTRFDQHIVIDLRGADEIDYCYPTRAQAEIKYNELKGA